MQTGIEIIKKKKKPKMKHQNKTSTFLNFVFIKPNSRTTSIHMIYASFYCPPEALWSRPAYNTKE